MDGTRVLAPAWPPATRRLSALRVVLADLERRGTVAAGSGRAFEDQVIVDRRSGPDASRGSAAMADGTAAATHAATDRRR